MISPSALQSNRPRQQASVSIGGPESASVSRLSTPSELDCAASCAPSACGAQFESEPGALGLQQEADDRIAGAGVVVVERIELAAGLPAPRFSSTLPAAKRLSTLDLTPELRA